MNGFFCILATEINVFLQSAGTLYLQMGLPGFDSIDL